MNVGLIDTGNFNRAERVSRVDERIAMPYPAFILPTYADKGKRTRTRKSRKNGILKRLPCPVTSAHVRLFAANQQQNLVLAVSDIPPAAAPSAPL